MKLSKDISAQPLDGHTPVDINLGPWRIHHAFARGPSSLLYRAHHRRSATPAVLKVMTGPHTSGDDFRARFENTLRSVVRLSHPGIIKIFDYGNLDDWDLETQDATFPDSGSFVVTEMAQHGGLHESAELPTWPVLRGLIAGVLDALSHAHARRTSHLNLTPSNILLGRNANHQLQIKLSDFGVNLQDLAGGSDHHLPPGDHPATYMAPEQFRPNWLEYGAWTDMYSLGAIAWELLCGSPPFPGATPAELAQQHTQSDLPDFQPAYQVPAGTDTWLRRMLAKEPADRFRYAADALRQLPAFGNDEELAGLRLLDDPSSDTLPDADEDLATYPTLGPTAYHPTDTVETPEEFKPMVSFDQLRDDEKKVGETGAGPIPEPPHLDLPEDWRPPDNNDDLPPARRHELTDAGLELANLREPPLVGRGYLRDDIWNLFLDTVSTQDRHRLALTGPLGIGKSKLAQWARERAQELGLAQGISVQWPKDGRDSDSSGLSRMLRRLLHIDGASSDAASERIERWFERHPSPDTGEGATVAPLIDDTPLTNRTKHTLTHVVAAVINWLVIDPPIRYRRVRLHTPDQKAAVAVRVIERMAARRPVILQLDVPHTDEAHAFLRELRTIQQPVLDIVTADTSRFATDDELQQRLDNVCDKQLEVEPLEEEKQKFLISRILSVSPGLADDMYRHTGGNPRLAVDTVSSWASRQFLQSGAEGFELTDSADPDISTDIAGAVRSHLEPILDNEPESMVRATELGAVGGTRIDRRDWEDVCHRANLPFPEGLIDSLTREKILDSEGDHWNFSNALARQFLLQRARRGDRLRDYHSVWADICKERQAGPERIADHLIASGRKREALEPLVHAMNHAGWNYDYDAALRCLNHLEDLVDSLDLPDDHPAKIEYHIGRAREIFTVRRHQADGSEHLDKALEGARTLGSDKLIGDALAQRFRLSLYKSGEQDSPVDDQSDEDLLERALELLDPVDHPDRWVSTVTSKAMYLVFRRGEPESACSFIEGILEQYFDQLSPRQRVTILNAKARAAFHADNFDTALQSAQQGIEVAHEHDLSDSELSFYNIAASVHFERGKLDHAERLIRETLKLSRYNPNIQTAKFEITLADILIERNQPHAAFEQLNQLPSVVREQAVNAHPRMYRLIFATTACMIQLWDEAEPHLTRLAEADLTAKTITPETERLIRRLVRVLQEHPDQSLRNSVIDTVSQHVELP